MGSPCPNDPENCFSPLTSWANASSPGLWGCWGDGRHDRRPRPLSQPRRRLPQGITWALPTDEEKPKEQTSSCATLTLQSVLEFTTGSKQTAPALHSAEQTLHFYLHGRQQFVAKGKARCSLRLDVRMVSSHSPISAG